MPAMLLRSGGAARSLPAAFASTCWTALRLRWRCLVALEGLEGLEGPELVGGVCLGTLGGCTELACGAVSVRRRPRCSPAASTPSAGRHPACGCVTSERWRAQSRCLGAVECPELAGGVDSERGTSSEPARGFASERWSAVEGPACRQRCLERGLRAALSRSGGWLGVAGGVVSERWSARSLSSQFPLSEGVRRSPGWMGWVVAHAN